MPETKEKTLKQRLAEAEQVIERHSLCSADNPCRIEKAKWELTYSTPCCSKPVRWCTPHLQAWLFNQSSWSCHHCGELNERDNLVSLVLIDD